MWRLLSLLLLLPPFGMAYAHEPSLAAPSATNRPAPIVSASAAPPPVAPSKKSAVSATASPPQRPSSRRRAAKPPPPAAVLYALNTHETFHLRPDAHGRFTRAVLRGWNRFLRCHHTGRVHAMSERLARVIYQVSKHFDWKRVVVVAGYRAPRVARRKGNPKSPHKKGVACDFRIEGVSNEELRDFERTLPHVGVGYYPNSEFVHLDVDPSRSKHSAFWIDYSGPGQRARYAKDPLVVLQQEREEREEEPPHEDDSPSPASAPSTPAATGSPALPPWFSQ